MATRRKDRALFGGAGRSPGPQEPRQQTADQEIAADIDQLEKDVHELRATYELYFMGVEKIEPVNQRDLLKAKLRRWQELRPRNTALRFRVQQLKARLVSLENYWERTTRQREAGTYRRDRARVERRNAELARRQAQQASTAPTRPSERPGESAEPVGESAAISGGGVAMPSGALRMGSNGPGASSAARSGNPSAGGGPSTATSRPRATSAEDLTEPKLRRLYQTYVGARKRCGESVDLRYEDMAAALRKQVPKLMRSTGAKSVEFKVVIRKGQAILKALPKQ